MKTTHNDIPIHLITVAEELTVLVNHLRTLNEFSMDTEFESFNKQYGIHLQLIQIFDGTACYLVDPLQIKDLSELWSVFENRAICKVVYSGANDVDVLKRNGCKPVNLFDVQIAAELCSRLERSLSGILQKEFDVELDKSTQAAGWGNRPLSSRQLVYAGNDVIYLLRLKELLLPDVGIKKVSTILQEKNIMLESASSKDYFPKLSAKQKKVYSRYSQQILLALKVLVDEYAQLLNLPPFKIVPDAFLEEVIQDPKLFLQAAFPEKKFHQKINKLQDFKPAFLKIVHSIDPSIGWENRKRR